MAYQWLLFDADGTLFDYQAAEEMALINTFDDSGIPFVSEYGEVYAEVNAALWHLFEKGQVSLKELRVTRFSQLFDRLAIKTDAQQFSATYLNFLAQATDLIPGAQETLQALSGQYRMAIITNGISEVQRSRLSLSEIKDFFEDIFISEEIGVSKPAAAYFHAVFTRIGRPPRDSALVIGDSLSSDIRGALNYGLDTCWYNPHEIQKPADIPINYEIKKLEQLLTIL